MVTLGRAALDEPRIAPLRSAGERDMEDSPRAPFPDVLRAFAHVGLNSFGGPAGQIAVMHREFVERRRWIGEERFLHALDLCMLLPGPEAQQLSVYLGWLLHGVRGGLAAGALFVLPGALVMLALGALYLEARELSWFQAALQGVQAAVLVVVALALVRIAGRALRAPLHRLIAGVAFLALFALRLPFPLVIVAALAAGVACERWRPGSLARAVETAPIGPRPSLLRSLRTLLLGAALWLCPLVLVAAWDGGRSALGPMCGFFARAALVTFGGAYAALSYTAHHAVESAGWVSADEMAVGLGLAETTPGPLILVLQFVAQLGAHHHPGALSPHLAGLAGAAVMLWATFVPCFVLVFALAPWMEHARASRALSGALAAVTAAVVGVILDLALWFALRVLFAESTPVELGPLCLDWPAWGSFAWRSGLLAALAAVLLLALRWSLPAAIAACALAGWALAALG